MYSSVWGRGRGRDSLISRHGGFWYFQECALISPFTQTHENRHLKIGCVFSTGGWGGGGGGGEKGNYFLSLIFAVCDTQHLMVEEVWGTKGKVSSKTRQKATGRQTPGSRRNTKSCF